MLGNLCQTSACDMPSLTPGCKPIPALNVQFLVRLQTRCIHFVAGQKTASKATSFYFKLGNNEEKSVLNVLHLHGGGLNIQIFATGDNMVIRK